jgi:cellulose synthase/poly-beta-1,6-N-acetylglucosamine synthase-like glycosyltransferase
MKEMLTVKIIFWLMLFTVFYAYIGYGILIFLITKIRRLTGLYHAKETLPGIEPEVTLFIAAHNERGVIAEKMKNTYELDYPREKLRLVWITDGSDDGTPDLLRSYDGVEVHHVPERNGKIGAMNRGMQFVKTPIVIFCDANTMLSPSSVRRIVALFNDPKVGCVSGEKRIFTNDRDAAAGAGEGLYWKYESTLKRWDAELYSVAGAAGELFAIRTRLFREMERDTLLDDFMISLRVAQQGYTIQYDPEAYAIETASADVKEELKRKIRISAGGLQSVIRLRSLLNVFKYGTLSFQFFSHRVLRWTLAPLSLLLLIPAGGILAVNEGINSLGPYSTLWWLQVLFYCSALAGWYLENRLIRIKVLFVPYYFFIMNLSVFMGFRRLVKGSQPVNWARARRGGS